MVNQSVRVQMSSETKLVLENLAQENGCLYGGKPHISGLLAQIADGRLVLNRAIPPQHSLPRAPLLKLRLLVSNRFERNTRRNSTENRRFWWKYF